MFYIDESNFILTWMVVCNALYSGSMDVQADNLPYIVILKLMLWQAHSIYVQC